MLRHGKACWFDPSHALRYNLAEEGSETDAQPVSRHGPVSGGPGTLVRVHQRLITYACDHIKRTGEHTVAIAREALLGRGVRWDYLFCLHRGGQGKRYEVWPVTVRQRLPRVWVPLAEGDPDLVLDWQKLFSCCYKEGADARLVNYRREPPTPLEGKDAEWAVKLLRRRKLRE